MLNMKNLIEKIDYFSCGYCVNKIENIFSGVKKKKLVFEAGVFLIKHKKYGYILYDTGYNTKLLKNNFKYFLYRFLNPVTLNEKSMINFQLEKAGINLNEIKFIILSHLHPDHIGGLEFFPNAKIIITKNCLEEYNRNSIFSLIFKEFFPRNFKDNLEIIEAKEIKTSFKYLKTYDLFSDGSILLGELNGHSEGQCCAYIQEKKLFIAADTIWRMEFAEMINKMKFLPRLIQRNFNEYKKSIDILRKIEENSIDVVVSHDKSSRIRRILNEKNN